ncbi:hypothetical protein RJ639_017034 [Escallonia herrerae]|uniref:Uncharacterized protein n=1 Tax=Escallonia herrerae TaxID=1293975 RepID=A0AA89AL77_9ASTE|nr:hypothetical protein RJ639_017034 [Escallonia herrerae]
MPERSSPMMIMSLTYSSTKINPESDYHRNRAESEAPEVKPSCVRIELNLKTRLGRAKFLSSKELKQQEYEAAKKKKKKSKNKKKKEVSEQTDRPTIPVTELFPSREFPEGEIQQYKDE